MDSPPFDLAEFLPYRLATAAARISRAFSEHYRARFGISVAEWRVLAHLNAAEGKPISVRDIEAKAELEKSAVSRAVSRLSAEGYVHKITDPADRRLLKLSLTPEGKAFVARILPEALAFQAALIERLGPDAAPLQQGLRALDRLSD